MWGLTRVQEVGFRDYDLSTKVQDKFRIQRFWCGDSGLGVTLGLQINQSRYCSSASGPKLGL